MWNIEVGYIQEWLDSLDEKSYTQVIVSLKILEEKGPTLGRPLVDKIKTSKHSNMKELRPGSSKRSKLRILFIFDPERNAILLIAGNKEDRWQSWYKEKIPKADRLYDEYLNRKDKENELK